MFYLACSGFRNLALRDVYSEITSSCSSMPSYVTELALFRIANAYPGKIIRARAVSLFNQCRTLRHLKLVSRLKQGLRFAFDWKEFCLYLVLISLNNLLGRPYKLRPLNESCFGLNLNMYHPIPRILDKC